MTVIEINDITNNTTKVIPTFFQLKSTLPIGNSFLAFNPPYTPTNIANSGISPLTTAKIKP